MRIGILVINGKGTKPSTNIRGTKMSRKIFFADENINNDFELIFGH